MIVWMDELVYIVLKNFFLSKVPTSELSASIMYRGIGLGLNSSGTKLFRTLLIIVGPNIGQTF